MNKKVPRLLLFDSVPLNLINQDLFIKTFSYWVKQKQKKSIFYLNAHGVVTSFDSSGYLRALKFADLIYPDGWGPAILARLFGHPWIERVNAADFIDKVLEILNSQRAKLYLLGCEKETVARTARVIKQKYKKINICGFHNGFFTKGEENRMLGEIRATKPNVLLIGMGIPKQELWVHNNWKRLPNGVYWTVGGLFYYISGLKSRAPLFMRRIGLEWLYRLFQEPRRLGKRYTVVNLKFMGRTFVSYLSKYFS